MHAAYARVSAKVLVSENLNGSLDSAKRGAIFWETCMRRECEILRRIEIEIFSWSVERDMGSIKADCEEKW